MQCDFNSIKVRLKLNPEGGTSNSGTFQFHKGTIKTIGHSADVIAMLAFQFHKGTIKTRSSLTAARMLPDFNSIKVRLKLQQKTPKKQYEQLFQFHKGTIKTMLC